MQRTEGLHEQFIRTGSFLIQAAQDKASHDSFIYLGPKSQENLSWTFSIQNSSYL